MEVKIKAQRQFGVIGRCGLRSSGFGIVRLIGAAGNTPVPGGHGRIGDRSIDGERRVDNGKTRAPLEISDEGGTELRIGGEFELVCSFKKEANPALALLLCDASPEVMADHGSVSSLKSGVIIGAAQYLSNKLGHMLKMLLRHLSEERLENRIGRNLLIEAIDETVDGF